MAVNRFWQQFFGTGLVKTSGDFGSQGEPPSHPELLDWLAVDFRESGWDVKRLVTSLVTSAAFRQIGGDHAGAAGSATRRTGCSPAARASGSTPSRSATTRCFVSGLMNPTMGGKGVKPYQPPNIWEPVGFVGSNTR